MRIASIALAGTVGAMGMLGHRRGGAVELFAAGGHLLVSQPPSWLAAVIGLVMHAVWMLFWSVIVVALMRPRRSARPSVWAAVVAAIAFAVSVALPGAVLGPVSTLTTSERALVHVVLALSLVIGIRLALPGDGRVVRRVSTDEGAPVA